MTALAIVSATKRVDSLASIALSVAILAFVVQILVFITQSWTTSQLNSETRAFLAQLQTSAEGTEKVLGAQVDKLTDHVLGRTVAASKTGQTAGEIREEVRSDVARILEAAGEPGHLRGAPTPRGFPFGAPSPGSVEPALQELLTFPSFEDAAAVAPRLKELTPLALSKLKRFSDDERDSLQVGLSPGLPMDGNHGGWDGQELLEKRFLERIEVGGRPYARLTALGRTAARLFLGEGRPPSWLKELFG